MKTRVITRIVPLAFLTFLMGVETNADTLSFDRKVFADTDAALDWALLQYSGLVLKSPSPLQTAEQRKRWIADRLEKATPSQREHIKKTLVESTLRMVRARDAFCEGKRVIQVSDLEAYVGDRLAAAQQEHLLNVQKENERLREELAELRSERVTGEETNQTFSAKENWEVFNGPVVQLHGQTVGSGMLFFQEGRENAEGYDTYVLTAWHVPRDMLEIYRPPNEGEGFDPRAFSVATKVYYPDGTIMYQRSQLIAYNVKLDAALLAIDTDKGFPFISKNATREYIRSHTNYLTPITAVGCPLGNDPVPSQGLISSTHHMVDGTNYFMMTAPTYVGNSGGGIFESRTGILLGVFSKIYTHGSGSREVIVPHMGLGVSVADILDWLERDVDADLVSRIENNRPRPVIPFGSLAAAPASAPSNKTLSNGKRSPAACARGAR